MVTFTQLYGLYHASNKTAKGEAHVDDLKSASVDTYNMKISPRLNLVRPKA